MQWLSRTIAVVILMVSPGLIGTFVDKRLGTMFFTPAGFLLGIVLATVSLLVLAQKLAPPAGGKPIPFDDPQTEIENKVDQEIVKKDSSR